MNEELAEALVDHLDHEEFDFFEQIESKISYTSRWSITKYAVFKDNRDNSYWKIYYDRGATEYQECDLNILFEKVIPVEKTVIVYEVKKEN